MSAPLPPLLSMPLYDRLLLSVVCSLPLVPLYDRHYVGSSSHTSPCLPEGSPTLISHFQILPSHSL